MMLWECVYRTPTAEGDHAKYAGEYARFGVNVYCNEDVAEKKQFPYGTCKVVKDGKTYHIGKFSVTPFLVHHDVPNYGYIIRHPEAGILFFATDTYKFDFNITGIDHWLIEANYDDRILRAAITDGKTDRAQANRLMLSHMSFDYTLDYLKASHAEKSQTITLIHLSERHSDPDMFQSKVEEAFGVPCQIARPGLVVELNREII